MVPPINFALYHFRGLDGTKHVILVYRAKMGVVIALLFEFFSAKTDKFRFDAALKIEVPN